MLCRCGDEKISARALWQKQITRHLFMSPGCFTSSLFCVKQEEKLKIVLTVGDPGVTEKARVALSSRSYSL